MIKGQVINGYPTAEVVFRLPGQPDLRISCVIYMRFAGCLTLPPAAIAAP